MFTVTRHNKGYRIKLYKTRSFIFAKNADEIATAVLHYYGSGCRDKKNENCPICRTLMQREKKGKKS